MAFFITTSIIMTAYFATILVIILRKQRGEFFLHARESYGLTLWSYTETMVIFGPGENMFICNGGTIPPIYDKIWIAKLINEGIMFVLALRKGIINMREYSGRWSGSKLTALLVKDSALYFLV